MSAQRVGPYTLGKTLGVGSTGRVKLGTHVETSHNVAVKLVSKEFLATKATLQKKIEREITLMKLIRHPNVLSLHDVYESDKELFLVLEYVEGGELFDYLVKRGRLPEREALIFFQQIISGLDFCHQHLVCHRDLKPENLLLDSSLNVKIADFGMATLQPEGKYLETSCGSPHYASPEIIRGEKYDGATSDIWSCGVILYALLTGNLPFDDENIRKLLGKVKAGVYFMPQTLSEGPRDLIRRMLVVDTAQRINMHQIKTHPWFLSNANSKSHSEVLPPIHSAIPKAAQDLDMEVVSNLQTLGYENENELVENILSKARTMEQIFYLLLCERKKEYFENGGDNDSDGGFSDDPQGPRRRSSSASGQRELANRMSFPGARSVPTSAATSASSSSDAMTAYTTPSPIASPIMASSIDKYVSSPLSNSSSANSMPVHNSNHSSSSNNSMSSPPTSPTGEEGRRTSASSLHSSPVRTRAGSDGGRSLMVAAVSPKLKRKPGAIDIPATGSTDGSQQIGSPRFHRQHDRASVDAGEPGSPSVANGHSTPKKSWFANLFNFKGEIITSKSSKPITETATILHAAFKSADAVFSSVKTNKELSYRCRADIAGKTARLRVDISAVPGEEKYDVVFVQERGSTQAFNAVVEAICSQAQFEVELTSRERTSTHTSNRSVSPTTSPHSN